MWAFLANCWRSRSRCDSQSAAVSAVQLKEPQYLDSKGQRGPAQTTFHSLYQTSLFFCYVRQSLQAGLME